MRVKEKPLWHWLRQQPKCVYMSREQHTLHVVREVLSRKYRKQVKIPQVHLKTTSKYTWTSWLSIHAAKKFPLKVFEIGGHKICPCPWNAYNIYFTKVVPLRSNGQCVLAEPRHNRGRVKHKHLITFFIKTIKTLLLEDI